MGDMLRHKQSLQGLWRRRRGQGNIARIGKIISDMEVRPTAHFRRPHAAHEHIDLKVPQRRSVARGNGTERCDLEDAPILIEDVSDDVRTSLAVTARTSTFYRHAIRHRRTSHPGAMMPKPRPCRARALSARVDRLLMGLRTHNQIADPSARSRPRPACYGTPSATDSRPDSAISAPFGTEAMPLHPSRRR